MKNIITLLCGTLFGIGLAVSGMTDTNVVLSFLDITGQWNPSLLVVMLVAVPITFIGYRWALGHPRPRFDSKFHLPTNTQIDKKLIVGALIFGAGWGLYGYCPGPAIASLAYLQPDTVVFVIAMLIGMFASSKTT